MEEPESSFIISVLDGIILHAWETYKEAKDLKAVIEKIAKKEGYWPS